jgi:hypothetical protein
VAVAVTALGERLVAEGAGVGARAQVRAHVVLHIAELGELLLAVKALQHLVVAACLRV